VLVIADTDLPVPLATSRLRVDVYSEEGVWLSSGDTARPDPLDWPVSFSVYAGDASRVRLVWVRLRAYLDGRTRDYRGEAPFSWGGPIDEPPAARDAPRLVHDGVDTTPASEPDPIDAVDRLALVELVPNEKYQVRLVLRGGCLGTSADAWAKEGEPCWSAPILSDPLCTKASAIDPPSLSVRGGNWNDPAATLEAAVRDKIPGMGANQASIRAGFRCARPAAGM
jgi:hypothetical protein